MTFVSRLAAHARTNSALAANGDTIFIFGKAGGWLASTGLAENKDHVPTNPSVQSVQFSRTRDVC